MKCVVDNVVLKWLVHRYRLLRYYFYMYTDQLRGIDLTEAVSVEELQLDPEKSSLYYASSPTLKRVLRKLKITSTDQIIDMGCGKGRAIYYMSKFPFHLIGGVEISQYLTEICKSNLKKLKIENCVIYNKDAGLFMEYDDYNYIYFYNPFSRETMEDCIAHIKMSALQKPRRITIIYHNPVYDSVVQKYGFKLIRKMHFDRFYIYRYDVTVKKGEKGG